MKTIPLLVVFATACFHEVEPPAPVPTATGTLAGIVNFIGTPCASPGPDGQLVERTGPGCNGPLPNYEFDVLAKDGKTVVAKATTDATGHYTIALPAGDYAIMTHNGMYPTDVRRNNATVTIGNTTKLDLTIDTGIR